MSRHTLTPGAGDITSELNLLAQETGRNRTDLVGEALRSCVTSERDFMSKVAAGLTDSEAGRTIDHQTVAAAIRRIYHPPA